MMKALFSFFLVARRWASMAGDMDWRHCDVDYVLILHLLRLVLMLLLLSSTLHSSSLPPSAMQRSLPYDYRGR